MKYDIIGSIVLTLLLMLVCNIFCLGIFESILLALLVFLILQYRWLIRGYWHNFIDRFSRKKVKKEVKSSYEHMSIDE
jgi:hypothetical protein